MTSMYPPPSTTEQHTSVPAAHLLPRLHLVDGTYELFRAHFAKRPDRPRKATLGVVASLGALLRDEKEAVTHLAVAFDNPIRSFRNELFADYKSDEGVPPELRAQFDDVEQAVRELGITVWSMDRYEADDAIATAVTRFSPAVQQIRILSPDKDFGQLLDGGRVVLVDRARKKLVSEAELRLRWGIGPAQVPGFLALVGDTADGIPGLPGFGEKTVSALLAHFGSRAAISDDPKTWPSNVRGAATLAATLSASAAEADLYERLATLARDVPSVVASTLEDLRVPGTRARPA